jgi:branched-chain amino acid transport system substrate-binding protein
VTAPERRRRRIPRLAALLAAVVAVAAAGCVPLVGGGAAGPGGARGPIRVALVDVFSGTSPYASQGAYLQNSLQLEIDAMNAEGGLLGSKVELVSLDDQLGLARTSDVVRQVVADRTVRLLVGPSFAGLYLAAKPQVAQAHLPNCLTNMAADDLMQGSRYSFRAQPQDHASVPALLGYVQHGTQLKKIGLIAEEDGVGQSFDQQLSGQAAHFGLQYLGAAFAPATGDQKAQVQQILRQGAEGVVLSNNPATATRTLQAIAALKVGARLRTFGFGGLAGYAFPQQAGDAANGVVFTSTIQSYLSDVPETRWPSAYHDFVKKAQARFGLAPNGVEMKAVPAAADCIVQWARAVQAANDFDGDKVARAWERLDLPAAQSVLGVRERFSADSHDAVPPDGIAVYQWARNGGAWGLKQLVGPAA